MLIPDLILLAVVLALAAWRLFAPAWRPARCFRIPETNSTFAA